METKRLAHIEKIINISPIYNSKNELMKNQSATILGWNCMIRPNEFKVGDLVVYIEVGSVMPDKSEYEFLRKYDFRVKNQSYFQGSYLSQGLALPISILPKTFPIEEGKDVTNILGIKKYYTKDELLEFAEEEKQLNQKKSKLKKFLMRYSWFRRLFLSRKQKEGFPYWVSKTDELKLQNAPHLLEQFKDKEVYVTEKIDCLDENTLILTAQGVQTIKEICESEGKTFVLSQDVETKKISFKPVLNKIIKPNKNKQWVKITLEDDTELLVTNDHRIWLPDLQCYRQVKDLTEKDFLLKLC